MQSTLCAEILYIIKYNKEPWWT